VRGRIWLWRSFSVLIALVAIGFGRLSAAPVDEKQVEAHLQAFYEAALWNDGRWPVWIRRWNKPLRVRMTGPMSGSYADLTMVRLKRMATLAGLEIVPLAADAKDQNFLIEFVETTQLYAGGRAAGCVAYTQGGNTTDSVRLVINLTMGFELRHCITHELMHAMGFQGHPHDIDTVLSYRYRRDDLTEIDLMLLPALYDKRLAPGMFQLPAMHAARDIIVDRLSGGDRSDAVRHLGDAYLKRLLTVIADLADKGNVGLQFQLGAAYTEGQIVDKNEAAAFPWLKRAATAAPGAEWKIWITAAQYLVGYDFQEGRGIAADLAEGARYYRLAADAGHVLAQNNLGVAYRDGNGVERDPVEAYKWFALAADKKFQLSQTNLRRLEPVLTPEQIVEAKKRAAGWKPAQ
jgi:TPR repeat protein